MLLSHIKSLLVILFYFKLINHKSIIDRQLSQLNNFDSNNQLILIIFQNYNSFISSTTLLIYFIIMKDHYEKLSTHLIFYNKKLHYKNIIEAKKCVNFQKFLKEIQVKSCVRPNHKYELQKDKQRRQINERLSSRISEIKNRSNSKQLFSKRYDSQKKKRQSYLYGNFYQFNQKIYQENIRFVQRLSQIKPAIGNREQWNKHYEKVKKIEKNMKRYKKDKYLNYQTQLREAISCLTKRSNQKQMQRRLLTTLGNYNTSTIQVSQEQNNKQLGKNRRSMLQSQIFDLSLTKSKTQSKIQSKTKYETTRRQKYNNSPPSHLDSSNVQSQFSKNQFQKRYNIKQRARRLNTYTYYKQANIGKRIILDRSKFPKTLERINESQYKIANQSIQNQQRQEIQNRDEKQRQYGRQNIYSILKNNQMKDIDQLSQQLA